MITGTGVNRTLKLTEDEQDKFQSLVEMSLSSLVLKIVDTLAKEIENEVFDVTVFDGQTQTKVVQKRLEGQGARKLAVAFGQLLNPKPSGDVIAGNNHGRTKPGAGAFAQYANRNRSRPSQERKG